MEIWTIGKIDCNHVLLYRLYFKMEILWLEKLSVRRIGIMVITLHMNNWWKYQSLTSVKLGFNIKMEWKIEFV